MNNEENKNNVMFKIEDLDLYYGDFQALKGITMDIPANKVTAFIGPSGCGKSTLLRCFNRMNDLIEDCRIDGKILLNGDRDIYNDKMDVVKLRTEIGMVFQHPNPFPMSIYDNVVYGLRVQGIKDKELLDYVVESSLTKAALWDEVKDDLGKNAHKLSGGQQQRVAIARALVTKPSLILADEPTGNLDSKSSSQVVYLLKKINKELGNTILMITHDDAVAQAAEKTLRIEDGRLVGNNESQK